MFKALYDTVIVEPEPVKSYEEQMGYTHIVTPDRFKVGPTDPPLWGNVIGLGSEVGKELRLSDRVLFGKFSGAKFKWGKKEYMAVKAHDILAVDR